MNIDTKIISTFKPSFKNLITQNNFFIRKYIFDFIKNNSSLLNGMVMDFGCGESPYKELFEYKEYIGLDIGESGHDNSNNKNIVLFDGKTIPFDNGYFDSFISTEVFEHVFDLNNTLLEINRVLKKGGYGIITNPFFIEEHEQPYDFARYTSFGMINILEKYGFEIIKFEKSGSYGKIIAQGLRNYIGILFSFKNRYINIFLKLFFVLPFHIIFLITFNIIPDINKNLYFNNLILVKKIKEIL